MNPTPARRRAPWFAALTAVALTAAGLIFVAAPAHAAIGEPSDPNYLGALTIAPTSGIGTDKLTSITADAGCPDGFRGGSRTGVYLEGASSSGGATIPFKAIASLRGPVDGAAINFTGTAAAAAGFSQMNPVWQQKYVGGVFQPYTFDLIVTCEAVKPTSTSVALPSDMKFFAVKIRMTSDGGDGETAASANNTWEVVTGSSTPSPTPTETPVVKTDTTTAVATSGVTATSAVLTATVSPSEAGGTVQFTKDGANLGAPVAVTGGQAAYTVSGLEPSMTYAIGASYSGDTTHNASSGSVSLTTLDAADTAAPSVGVTVPTATTPTPTGLKMSAKPTAVTLTGPATRTAGEVWTATGELGTVTVNDDRQSESTPWTLNGRISALTSGSNQIAASNVGWKPAKVDGSGLPGAEVEAAVSGGLSSAKPLATGTGSATANVTTSVGATITLKTPADAPAGAYTGTLTLTLI